MGTDAQLVVITGNPASGNESLRRAVEDLEITEQALSRFRTGSELSQLNRAGTLIPGERLLTALRAAARAYARSEGLLDPRIIGSLERLGYREVLPEGDVETDAAPEQLPPVDMGLWIDEATRRVTLPPGTRLDLAGVGKALGIGWAALHLAGHEGLLVDVGGDIVALGRDEQGELWRIAVDHNGIAGELSGSPLAIATSTTTRRAWTVNGKPAHHLIDPRTGAPSEGELAFATVAAPTILEADFAAKLLVLEGMHALRRIDNRCQVIITSRHGHTEGLNLRARAGASC